MPTDIDKAYIKILYILLNNIFIYIYIIIIYNNYIIYILY